MPVSKPKKGPHLDLAKEKLALSELSLEDAQELGMEILTAAQTQALGFDPLPSIKLNYFDIDGKPATDWPKGKPFYRIRYLGEPNTFAKVSTEKPQRYTQPADTACCAYFPKSVDWTHLLKGHDEALIITEGELKAASACKHGFSTIGLGGVYSWRSLPKGLEFLPELERIVWSRRHVYICFDSDYLTNPMVLAALNELGQALVDRGAYVYVTTLPELEQGKKTGLDDFLLNESPEAFAAELHRSSPLGLTKALFGFNDNYVYVSDPGLIMHTKRFLKMTPGAFVEHQESEKKAYERTLKPDGSISTKAVSASGAWVGWSLRHRATRLTYLPGQPARVDTDYNIWPGWGCEPKKGDVKPFMALLDHLFSGAEPEAKEWFLRWCAWPIKHPGAKMFSAAVFHGITQGTGKSLVGYTLKEIYGKNFTEISQADLHGGFNEWADGKQLVMGDDVTGSNKREDNDVLKKLITQKELRVNIKYIPSYTIPDCLNYFFTSNHPDAFFLEDTDRRFFIHEILVDPLVAKFYKEYMKWLKAGGGAAVFHYFLNMDFGKFDPNEPAFRTAARARLIATVQSDLGAWVRRLKSLPEQVLKIGEMKLEKDLYTDRELLLLYDPLDRGKVTSGGLGRELKRAGIHQVLGGALVAVPGQPSDKYYAVRNITRWSQADHGACVKHLMEQGGDKPKGAKKKGEKF